MKVTLSLNNTLEFKKNSLISEKDTGYVLNLYAPIIGLKNASIYLAMTTEETNKQISVTTFLTKYHISSGEFEGSLSYLEAIGLISTYKAKNSIVFVLYSPRNPEAFFAHELLYGLLCSYLDLNQISVLKKKYEVDSFDPNGYENVSEPFYEVFQIDTISANNVEESIKKAYRPFGKLEMGFSYQKFIAALQDVNPMLDKKFISNEEVSTIAKIAALYSYDEEAMASFVADSYQPRNPLGRRIDIDMLKDLAIRNTDRSYLKKEALKPTSSELHGRSASANVIRKMDSMPSEIFLSKLQKGNLPAKSDIRLIRQLKEEIGLPDNVINALFFYITCIEDKELGNAYVTKIGASLVRKGITNALDALNYLGRHNYSLKRETPEEKVVVVEKNVVGKENEEQPRDKLMSYEEFDAILDED